MEKQLFDWESQDNDIFHKVKLKRKIGKFEAGTEFKSVSINWKEGKLKFYNDFGGILWEFDLVLGISYDEGIRLGNSAGAK